MRHLSLHPRYILHYNIYIRLLKPGTHPSPSAGSIGRNHVIQLRLVQLPDVHRHATDVAIVQLTAADRRHIGRMSREDALAANGRITPRKII